jgi:tRNA 2-thiouridine synthesizing protein E
MHATSIAPAVVFDEDGLVLDPLSWNEDVAQSIAYQDGIGPLTENHWKIIRSLRDYYAEFGVAPAMSQVCRAQDMPRHAVHDLFRSCLGAWRISGLPNPGQEATAYLGDM